MLRRRKPTRETLERQLRYAYVQLRKDGAARESAAEVVAEAEYDYQWFAQLRRLPDHA